MKRSRRTALLVVVLVVVACSDGGEDGAAPESDAPTVEALDPLWSVEGIHVVSHPVAAGGTAVVRLAEEGELFLAGYDPATGDERWRIPSAAPSVSPETFPGLGDVPSDPLAVDDMVIHLVPGVEPGRVYVEAVDAQTGEALWRSEQSPPMLAWMGACDGEERRVCAVVATPSPSGAGTSATDGPGQALTPTIWAVDVADGTIVQDLTGRPVRSDNPRSSLREPDIAIARIRGPGLAEEQRLVATTGEVLWTRSWQELFGDQRFDLEDGSESQVYWSELDGLLVGMVDVSGGLDQQRDGTTELTQWATSGIDPDSGETLWTVPGSGFCGGVYQLLLDVEGVSTAIEETDTIIRCAAVGTVKRTDGRPQDYEMDVTITQVAVSSGDTVWSADLPGFDYYLGESPLVRLDPTTFAGQQDDGSRFALDLATGELRDAEPDEVGWCFSENEYPYLGADEPTVPGARFTRPCDLTGAPQPTPAAADEGLGATIDGTFIWMDDTGLHAAEA